MSLPLHTAPVVDLRAHPPRRWNAAVGGIVWLARLIDKARAYDAGTLGVYLFGQSPIDRSFLAVAGVDHPTFLCLVRASHDDQAVLDALEHVAPGAGDRLRAWSEHPPLLARAIVMCLDLDEGYARGPAALLARKIPARVWSAASRTLRRILPLKLDDRD